MEIVNYLRANKIQRDSDKSQTINLLMSKTDEELKQIIADSKQYEEDRISGWGIRGCVRSALYLQNRDETDINQLFSQVDYTRSQKSEICNHLAEMVLKDLRGESDDYRYMRNCSLEQIEDAYDLIKDRLRNGMSVKEPEWMIFSELSMRQNM